ncbi:MAG: hypothetical protein AAGI38_02500 [Bacteroidota bacterium]
MRWLLLIVCLLLIAPACNPDKKTTKTTAPATSGKTAAAWFQEGISLAQQIEALGEVEGQAYQIDLLNDQALYAFNQAISLDPTYESRASGFLGHAYFLKGDHQAAALWLQAGVEEDPGNYLLYRELGLSHMNVGQIEPAKKALAQSIGLNDTENHRQNIIQELYKIGQKSFEFGQEYIGRGYPKKGADYQTYGIVVLQLAFDLDDSETYIAEQIVSYAELIGDEEKVKIYQPYLK